MSIGAINSYSNIGRLGEATRLNSGSGLFGYGTGEVGGASSNRVIGDVVSLSDAARAYMAGGVLPSTSSGSSYSTYSATGTFPGSMGQTAAQMLIAQLDSRGWQQNDGNFASYGADSGWQPAPTMVLEDVVSTTRDYAWGEDLSGGEYAGADFSYANMSDVDFSMADLSKVNFAYTLVYGANFTGADITGAKMYNVQGLTAEQVRSSVFDFTTDLPADLTYLHFEKYHFTGGREQYHTYWAKGEAALPRGTYPF
ncbi:MAG: pentapeptide repeat-containing protein [Magnetospirillum sp.]|nr:pentapeptide repeat-containing protein [Magnetospirillum sp.]